MVSYYLIGNWMGSFRTKSSTETVEEFLLWAKKNKFTPNVDKIWRNNEDGGRVVFESLDEEAIIKLNNPHIGI